MATATDTTPLNPSTSAANRPEVVRSTSRGTTSSSTFTTFRDAFSRALSPHRESSAYERRASFGNKMSGLEDGRGRQPIVSTGRGGVGNLIRSPSRGVDPDVHHGLERGREVGARDASRDRVFHSGRGGAGNIRAPSQGPKADREAAHEAQEENLQARLVAEERGRQAAGNYSTGRGGAGNISRSKSRSRSAVRDSPAHGSPAPEYRAAGRGGWGNIREEDHERNSIEEQKRAAAEEYERGVRAKHDAEEANKPHSSGKGGAGNIVTGGPPGVDMSQLTLEEREAYDKVHAHDRERGVSTGRGGGGNVHRLVEEERGRGGTKEPGLVHNVLRSLSRATGRERSADRRKGD